jgi:hypothetical protein
MTNLLSSFALRPLFSFNMPGAKDGDALRQQKYDDSVLESVQPWVP